MPESSSINEIVREVVVRNPKGLHMRHSGMIAMLASKYESKLEVSREDGKRISARSILDLMSLSAPCSTRIFVYASGSDAAVAADALAELIGSDGDN